MKTITIFSIVIFYASSLPAQTEKISSLDCIPVPAICYPLPVNSGGLLGIGITYVSLDQIQNTSGHTNGVFENYTCTDSTQLDIGMPYTFNVITGQTYEESITAWIDFNNDGDFSGNEIVFHDSAVVYTHYGTITIPSGVPNQNAPIRMRVGSDYAGPSLTGCSQPFYGEYEDYKIYYGLGNGIAEINHQDISSVYPNPLHTSAKIELSNKSFMTTNMQLCIYNSFGQIVSTKEISAGTEIIIDRGTLANGFYFFELTNSFVEKTAGKFQVE